MTSPAPTAAQLERLFAAAFGRPIRVRSLERLAPWSVLRCELEPEAANAGAPGSVVVKWLRDDPRGLRIDPRQIATEQAALEFLAEIGFPHAPRLIAADRAAGMLALEDLSPCTPLADLLRRQGAAASAAVLLAFARTMGELGAATAGRSAAYDAIRGRYGPVDPQAGRERGLGPLWPDAWRRLAELGLPMTSPVERDLAGAVETLLHPGAFLAFSNGDPEANNFLVGGDGGRLIDFEFAAYRHAMTSAVCMHVPGPAWITVEGPFCADLEHAYRRALAAGIVEAEDDRLFGFGMAGACLAMACDRLGRFAILDRRAPGERSRLQMVSTLEAAAGVARRHRALPQLAGWTERAAHWLRRRWPDADADFAGYPAYAPR